MHDNMYDHYIDTRGITSQSALTVHSESISVHPHHIIKLYIMQQAHAHCQLL